MQIVNRIRRCKWGWMIYPVHDQWVGRSLDLYGEFSGEEVDTLLGLLPPDGVFIDVGANIGALALPLARKASFGYAIEPQRLCHQALCAALAINGIANVQAIHAGAGASAGVLTIMQPSWDRPNNIGGYSLTLGSLANGAEQTRIITIDGLEVPHCDLIKIDVEGMEAEVLQGARETIKRCRPVLYVEADRHEKTPALIGLLHESGYGTWWDVPPLYRVDNYAKNPDNMFQNIVSINLLCLPDGRTPAVVMEPALAGDDFPKAQARVLARDNQKVA